MPPLHRSAGLVPAECEDPRVADSAVNRQEILDRRTIARRKARLCKIVLALPDTTVTGDQHLSLFYKKKRFGYYLDDRRGDAGRVTLSSRQITV